MIELKEKGDNIMNREEILAKSREENNNKDLVSKEASIKAGTWSAVVSIVMSGIFFSLGIILQGQRNWGFFAITAASTATAFLYNGILLKKKTYIAAGVIWVILAIMLSINFANNLVNTSTIL